MAESAATAGLENFLAAVDLGSNSFHMVVAEEVGSDIRLHDRLREGVRLAEGLRDDGSLDPEVEKRALDCLARFGQRLRGIRPERVRVIGTNTLRQASATEGFIRAIENTLGYPLEIVAGREEARLVYLGVAHSLAVDARERRLVVDIGGGSTELIAGQGFIPDLRESLHFGCVASTRAYFPDEQITAPACERLEKRVRMAVEPMLEDFASHGWDQAVGSSGTIKSIGRILAEGGQGPRITRAGLHWLREQMMRLGSVRALTRLKGLKPDRAAVFPGGFIILFALFESLGLQEMRFSEGALREGAIYDLLGRIHQEDTREMSICSLQERFHSQVLRNQSVARWAERFFTSATRTWPLHGGHQQWLHWAALTHDIGLDIAHSGFHKHGEYVWRNADIAGFSRREQGVVAALLRAQRKRLPGLAQLRSLGVAAEDVAPLQQLAILLRMAILFHRGALPLAVPPELTVTGRHVVLHLPARWLTDMPLLAADLEQEQEWITPDFHLQW
ncbi:Ppx/GppA family phosphatase [Acidithiobacillus sp. 'AMD consortium']|uniref:Exopolyphosphatase n=2 Tax=Acidithiobacillus ferridurans TaxID=1232575 RepID=A0A2Z6IMM9_ACIFI|nr:MULTISPECIES: Ppx/GppA phosphatase family protein [Acidithiobacillus]MBU2716372.1 Ppx/GppA family phosphatase [Acidithiobacillus ferridurans]MBU2724175.1 Ppx/GppA family phosphatase [Acidithiobacillus ferridurans]MBU2727720.1 Ppx/GppA family phosphatase [Acidithiobacillus ferridurans]MBU2804698.1 Ppx/GppA family phosphatase [Acidithiobacillus ferridurans]QFG78231.1 Ppx/GppA family phosphatase [Acidithiobacillus sp. 'AMD consortium']